jgi:hypothetical protein
MTFLGAMLIVAGASFASLRWLQGSNNLDAYYYPAPTLYSDAVIVYLKGGSKQHAEAFRRAVEDWDEAVEQFNRLKDIECSILRVLSCSSCLREPRLPRISVAEGGGYNVLVEYVDEMPVGNVVAYTEPYLNGSIVARIVIWAKIPEHRAYQVAVHEIARLYGVDVPEVHRTLFGAVPAGSDTSKLNPSMEQFMNGPPDPIKPTTLDLYTAFEALKNPEGGVFNMEPGTVFRAYDEPDFTIPTLASPALIVSGLYILSRGWRYAG